jgi:hypothetical protein
VEGLTSGTPMVTTMFRAASFALSGPRPARGQIKPQTPDFTTVKMRDVTVSAVLIFFGVLAIGLGIVVALVLHPIRRAQRSPVTPSQVLLTRAPAAETIPGAAMHPKLSPNGDVVATFASAFGLFGIGVSWATLHNMAEEHRYRYSPAAVATVVHSAHRGSGAVAYQFEVHGRIYEGTTDLNIGHAKQISIHYLVSDPSQSQPIQASPPVAVLLLAPAVLDLPALWLLLKLRRHCVLAREGRLTSGIVVAYGIRGRVSLGQLIPTLYDFLPASGAVVRGLALLSSYSRESPFFKTSVGSVVEVLYLPDNPRCNGLRLSLLWTV